MTTKELFEYSLIEQKKVNAPSLNLEEWNYFANKALNQYINKKYNGFEINQQATDDLSRLKTTISINIQSSTSAIASMVTGNILDHYQSNAVTITPVNQGIKFLLPLDYYHITRVNVYFKAIQQKNCYQPGDIFPAIKTRRITDSQYQYVLTDFYQRPSYTNVLYLISDNPDIAQSVYLTTVRTNLISGANNAEIEILTGNHPKFSIEKIEISYIRVPKVIQLTYTEYNDQTLAGSSTDTSATLEFPNYICQEILNEMMILIFENASDPRQGSQPNVSMSIAPPQVG